jgi:hypothetical protein
MKTDEELIWESYIVERQDVEKMNIVKRYVTDIMTQTKDVLYKLIQEKINDPTRWFTFSMYVDVNIGNTDVRIMFIRDDVSALAAFMKHKGKFIIHIYSSYLVNQLHEFNDLLYTRKLDEEGLRGAVDNILHVMSDGEVKSSLFHELVHFYDSTQTDTWDMMDKYQNHIISSINALQSKKDVTESELESLYQSKYFNAFYELNAFLLQSMFDVEGKLPSTQITAKEFIDAMLRTHNKFFTSLDEKNRKRILKRSYLYWVDMQK